MKESSFHLITTHQLVLRRFELSDAAEVQRLAGDKDVTLNTLNMPYPYLDGMAEEWKSRFINQSAPYIQWQKHFAYH